METTKKKQSDRKKAKKKRQQDKKKLQKTLFDDALLNSSVSEGVRALAPPSAEVEEVRAVAPSSPPLKVALSPPRTPVAASVGDEFPKLSYDAEVESDLYLYDFSVGIFLRAMAEYSPTGQYSLKDIGCKFMTMPLKVRIKRLTSAIEELDANAVLGSPCYQKFPKFVDDMRSYLRGLLKKSKQAS